MLRYIIWTLIIYGLFRLIFNFIIPVFRATRQMRSQVKEFQDRMQTNMSNNTQQQAEPQPRRQENKSAVGDYIDFEEVKG